NAGAGELEGDGIDIADDDDTLPELDVELFGDFFPDGAGGALALECRQLLGRHLPIFANIKNQIGIDGKTREKVLRFFVLALKPRPGRDFFHAGDGFDALLMAGRQWLGERNAVTAN